MNKAYTQLQSIQSMLTVGHRSVHLEQHSLLLIGTVGGLIAGLTETIITAERFPDPPQRALALLLWLGFWLSGMAFMDHRLTRLARQRRDETLPFAQAQITRAWWMLLCMGSLGSFAMFFYGGGGMIYALWIILLGLGVYLFGLFSQPLVEWIGLATILLGVTSLAAGLPYGATHALAVTCFIIGMPLAGWLSRHYGDAHLLSRAVALFAWLALVTIPALLFTKLAFVTPPATHALSLNDFTSAEGEQVLRLESGTPVALKLDLDSAIIAADPTAHLTMQLTQPVEVALKAGQPDGRYRIAGGKWRAIHDGVLEMNIDRLQPTLEQGQPTVRVHALFGAAFLAGEAHE